MTRAWPLKPRPSMSCFTSKRKRVADLLFHRLSLVLSCPDYFHQPCWRGSRLSTAGPLLNQAHRWLYETACSIPPLCLEFSRNIYPVFNGFLLRHEECLRCHFHAWNTFHDKLCRCYGLWLANILWPTKGWILSRTENEITNLKRNCLFRLLISIVSISMTWMSLKPVRARLARISHPNPTAPMTSIFAVSLRNLFTYCRIKTRKIRQQDTHLITCCKLGISTRPSCI